MSKDIRNTLRTFSTFFFAFFCLSKSYHEPMMKKQMKGTQSKIIPRNDRVGGLLRKMNLFSSMKTKKEPFLIYPAKSINVPLFMCWSFLFFRPRMTQQKNCWKQKKMNSFPTNVDEFFDYLPGDMIFFGLNKFWMNLKFKWYKTTCESDLMEAHSFDFSVSVSNIGWLHSIIISCFWCFLLA